MGVLNRTTSEINDILDKVNNMPEGGAAGKTPVLETGETTTLSAGDNATAEVVRSGEDASGNPKYKLNFGIPKGKDGVGGSGGGTADSVDWDDVLNKPSWVNRGTKPAYTATEVGALPNDTAIPSKVSELENDSLYVKSTELKTINGASLTGSGNIEISWAGGGIADAPGDGLPYVRKSGAWAQADMVNVTDIMESADNNTLSQANVDKLKGYISAGKILFVSTGETNAALHSYIDDSTIELSIYQPYGTAMAQLRWSVNLSTRVLESSFNIIPDATVVGSVCELTGYSKASTYSAISDSDSINIAIGKLEAGLANGGSNVYVLPSAILSLTNESTSAEILTAFGGQGGLEEIYNATKDKKCFYFNDSKNSLRALSAPVGISFQKVSTLISVGIVYMTAGVGISPLTIYEMELQGNISSPSFTKREIYPKGYPLKPELMHISSSTSDEISTAVGGETGLKKIIKAADDGNRFIISGPLDSAKMRFELSIMYGMEESGNMTVMFSGIGYGLFGSMGGILMIQFDKATETFSATSVSIAT